MGRERERQRQRAGGEGEYLRKRVIRGAVGHVKVFSGPRVLVCLNDSLVLELGRAELAQLPVPHALHVVPASPQRVVQRQ